LSFIRRLSTAALISLTMGLCLLDAHTAPLQPVMTPSSLTTRAQDRAGQALHTLSLDIASDGAAVTARALSQQNGWGNVTSALAQGQPEVAPLLSSLIPESSGHTTTLLRRSMKSALPRHPAVVLSALREQTDSPVSPRDVCSAKGMSRHWRKTATQAVATVHDIRLSNRARQCLRLLHDS
jgi:CheY-like chemotaxis protein